MKIWKIILLSFLSILIVWISLKLLGFKTHKIPTTSMENTITRGSRIFVLEKKFIPERFEIITYRNPEFDTVISPYIGISYYSLIREIGIKKFNEQYKKVFVPLNEREVWVGRCVGVSGDRINIVNSRLFVNDELYENSEIKKRYSLKLKENVFFNSETLSKLGIHETDVNRSPDMCHLNLTKNQLEKIIKFPNIDSISIVLESDFNPQIFPYDHNLKWNSDNFGNLIVPKKGIEIQINKDNIALYERLIRVYEQNELAIINDDIYINNNIVKTYTPKMNYYFIICDNRDYTVDSRYWGFLPENHLCGKVLKIIK